MATARSARRRSAKAVAHVHETRPTLATSFVRAATSGPAKAAYVAIGVAGLAGLAVAILGPKRLERDVLRPLRGAVAPPAEKLWEQLEPLRHQIAGLFDEAGPAKDRLARQLQSWVGHFRAT